jgi:hypothetical protein
MLDAERSLMPRHRLIDQRVDAGLMNTITYAAATACAAVLPSINSTAIAASALDFVDAQDGRIADAVDRAGATGTTTVIPSAKRGHSPMQPQTLTRIDDGAIIDETTRNGPRDIRTPRS